MNPPGFGENTAGPARKRQKGALILDVLEEVLEGEEKVSLSRAAVHMRARLKDEGQDYDAILKKAQAHEGENARGKPWYYVSLA